MDENGYQEKVQNECVCYFKARPVFRKVFEKFREKYISLGHFGGTVTLQGLTPLEKEQLGGFVQKDYTKNKRISLSAALMNKALASSRFSTCSFEKILEEYFGEPLTARKEKEQKERLRKQKFFAEIIDQNQNTQAGKWLEYVLENRADGYLLLMQQYKESPENLKEILARTVRAIQSLPLLQKKKKKKLLAVYAAEITGNPHAFDDGTPEQKLCLDFLTYYLKLEEKPKKASAEWKIRLLYEAGILKDDLSNDALVYGIRAWKNGGELHAGIEGFLQCREPMRLTLQTLGSLEKIKGQTREVYIVENPAVFSKLLEKYPEHTFVCGYGQITFAVYVLLDKLAENSILYYAGDYDPEGLLIAQDLKRRYQDRLFFGNYKAEWYQKYLSEVALNDSRIKKLDGVVLKDFDELKEAMKRERRATYQEAMIGEGIFMGQLH